MQERETGGATTVLAILHSTGRERDIAMWHACAEIDRDLERYQPPSFRLPNGWSPEDQKFVDTLRPLDGDSLRDAARSLPSVFGAYRLAVFNLEGDRAKRLQTLAWSLQTLTKLRELDGANTAMIDPLLGRLREVLTFVWRVPTLPTTGDHRAWSARNALRDELLPKAWRYL